MSPALLLAASLAATDAAPAASAAPGVKPVPAMVREILADKKFEFCHDPRYPLTAEEAKLCPLIVSSDQACPALASACKHGAGATQLAPPRKVRFSIPEVAGLSRVMLLALLGLGIAAVIYIVIKNVRPWQRRPKTEDQPQDEPAAAEVVVPSQVETDVERLLARARAAAAAGDYARAIMEVHAALLRRLEGAGVVAVHPSRTNGDYVRAVAGAKPDLAAPVRSFVVDVERVQYGHGTATGELFQALLARLALVSPDKLLALVLVGALALGGVAGCGADRGGWEHSPSGRAGVKALLKRAGRQVHERILPVTKLKTGDVDAVVVLPGGELSDDDWARLESWVSLDAGVLLLAGMPSKRPDWVGGQDLQDTTEDKAEDKAADKAAAKTAAKTEDQKPPAPAINVVAAKAFLDLHGAVDLPLPPGPSLRVGSAYDPLLVRGANGPIYAAHREYGDGVVLALADDRLFTNGALPFGDNARALVLLLSDTERVELVGELTGFVSPNPVASVTRGRLAPLLAQLAALCAVFFLFRGVAFGRLREPPPPLRRSFVEHVEALGEQYARARAARHVLASYGHWVVERLRDRVALPAGSGLIALADAVAVRTGKPAGEVMRLLMEARELPAPATLESADDVAVHLAAVRQLGELLSFGSKK